MTTKNVPTLIPYKNTVLGICWYSRLTYYSRTSMVHEGIHREREKIKLERSGGRESIKKN